MRNVSLVVLLFSILLCVSTAALSQQSEGENSVSRTPVFSELIDGNISPDQIPMAHVYAVLSSAMVESGPGRCSNPSRAGDGTTPPCRTLIEGLNPATLEQLGEVTLAFNYSEDARWVQEVCTSSEAGNMRSSTVEEFSSFLELSELDSQQNKVTFFNEKVSELFDAEEAEKIFSFANSDIRKNTQYMKMDYRAMMSATRLTPARYLDSLCK